MLNFLRELVEISSETKDIQGVEKVQQRLAKRLGVLDGKLLWIESELPEYGPSLFGYWGHADHYLSPDHRGICIVTHADTVYPTELLRGFELDTENGRALGGGVADNKGGMVIANGAIEKLFSSGLLKNPKRPLYLLCSSCEEMGSPGFQSFIKELSGKIDFVLGLEPALPGGHLIRKRRGNRYYKFEILGNSVHTGRDLSDAANPVQGLIILHGAIAKLSLKYPHLSVSINGIESFPFKYNMSSQKITVTMDLRFHQYSEAKFFHEGLERELNDAQFYSQNRNYSGRIEMQLVDDCPSFESPISAELSRAQEIYSAVENSEVKLEPGLGASDCCYFAREHLQIIDGLGPRGGAIHSDQEFIELKSLDQRAHALAEYLAYLIT